MPQPVRQPASVSPPSVCCDKNRPYLPLLNYLPSLSLSATGATRQAVPPSKLCVYGLISGLFSILNISSNKLCEISRCYTGLKASLRRHRLFFRVSALYFQLCSAVWLCHPPNCVCKQTPLCPKLNMSQLSLH